MVPSSTASTPGAAWNEWQLLDEATLVLIASPQKNVFFKGSSLGILQYELKYSCFYVFKQPFPPLETIFLNSLHCYKELIIIMEKKKSARRGER